MFRSILGLLLLLPSAAWCATPVSEAWRVVLPGAIVQYEVSELGELLVETSAGLHGIDHDTGTIQWTRPEFGSTVTLALEPIAGSPFYKVVADGIIYILDIVNGKILFDSLRAGIDAVDEVYFLYGTDSVLVKGKSNRLAEAVVVLVNMRTAEVAWTSQLELGKVLSVQNLGRDRILVVTLFDIFSIDAASGEVAWRVPTTPDLQMTGNQRLNQMMMRFAEEVFRDDAVSVNAVLSPDQATIYLGVGATSDARATYMALDARTGERRWSRELAGNYPGFQTLLPGGILVMPYHYERDTHVFGGNKVNLLDYRTGESKWGKKNRGLDLKGGVTSIYQVRQGMMLSAYSGGESYLYLLDAQAGEFVARRPIEIDGYVRAVYETASGLLCFTRDHFNLLDLDSGKFQWRRPIEATPELTAMQGTTIYAYDSGSKSLVAVDTRSGEVRELASKSIRFEGREKPSAVEVTGRGVLVTSEQNMTLVSRNGDLVYQRYYPAPRRPGWVRALYYAQGIRAAIISAQSYYVTGAMIGAASTREFRDADVGTRSIVTGIAGAYGETAQYAQSVAAESFRRANERFKASSVTRDAQIILSEMGQRVQLLKVSKATGEVEATLDMGGNQEPEYAVDPVSNQVYLKTGDTGLASYRF